MAKQYAYYIEGTKLGIVEKDTTFNNNIESKEFGPGVARHSWKSPQSSVEDAIEIKYSHSPDYFIKSTNTIITSITNWRSNGGFLQIKGGSVNYDTTLDVDNYFVLRNAGQHNGLHRIKEISNVDGTKDGITTYTKISGSSGWSTNQQFEETVTMYYSVDVISDEDYEVDLPSYLQKALVYYIKAKVAEDSLDIQAFEYFMKQYKKIIEKYESTRISGPRIISPGSHSIR